MWEQCKSCTFYVLRKGYNVAVEESLPLLLIVLEGRNLLIWDCRHCKVHMRHGSWRNKCYEIIIKWKDWWQILWLGVVSPSIHSMCLKLKTWLLIWEVLLFTITVLVLKLLILGLCGVMSHLRCCLCFIEGLCNPLCFCIATWFNTLTVKNKNQLGLLVKKCKISGRWQDRLSAIYNIKCA